MAIPNVLVLPYLNIPCSENSDFVVNGPKIEADTSNIGVILIGSDLAFNSHIDTKLTRSV